MTQTAEDLLPIPVALPKLTFLCGPPDCGQVDLTQALCDRDPELLPCDFLAPIRMATAMLFFNGNFMQNDLTNPTISNQQISVTSAALSYHDWMRHLTDELVQIDGDCGILGRIALKDMTEDGEIDDVFARSIFRDCHNLADAKVFIDKFSAASCLLIHLGPLTASTAPGIPGCKSIWLPESGLKARMKLLEHELNLQPRIEQ